MNIQLAQFWNAPNQAGLPTFSYAELLAQLEIDFAASGLAANPNIGKGVALRVTEAMENLTDNVAFQLNWRGNSSPSDPIIEFDDFGFYDNASPTVLATIPDIDPPIQRVTAWCTGFWSGPPTDAHTGLRFMAVEKNLSNLDPGLTNMRWKVGELTSLNPDTFPIFSGVIAVVPGDQISIELGVQGVGANTIDYNQAKAGVTVVL